MSSTPVHWFSPGGRPACHTLNRGLHRLYVRRQDGRDQKAQRIMGLSTFPRDWERHVIQEDKPSPQVPRIVWMLWLQGEDAAPPLVQASFKSWRAHNPTWEVVILDETSLHDYIDLPTFPAHLRHAHIADIIRLELLARYGGVWADATTLCLQPLDAWIDHVTTTGFFAFTRPQPLRELANWFIAAAPHSPFVEAWLRWSRAYILSEKKPSSYFWSHHTFNWLIRRNWALRRAWRRTPHLSAQGPHILQRILDEHLDAAADPTPAEMAMLPLVKLNWKKGYTLEGIDEALEARGITRTTTR